MGGQFAPTTHAESSVSLDIAAADGRAFPDTPETFTQRYESVEAKVTAFKDELDQAVADLATDENWLNYCSTMSRFHSYSFNNQMLIHLQSGGRATRVAGYRRWQNDFGRQVNDGEKGIGILAPKKAWVTAKDANGDPVKDDTGKPVRKKVITGWTTATVFDVSQTHGEPLPEVDRELSEDPPPGMVEDLTAAAEAKGYSVEFRNLDSHARGSAQGWTDPRGKSIVIDADLTSGSQAATLAHEVGHVYAGHCEPDAKGKYHTGEGGCRGRFEVEAESVAYSLARANGMSMDGSKLSAQYVAGWSRHDKDALRESAQTVAKTTTAILTSVPFRNLTIEPHQDPT